MRRAGKVLHDGSWPTDKQVGTVTLAYIDRHRRRIVLADDAGLDFLLDLPDAVALAHGDGLALDDGGVIKVMAANEDVADIACQDATHLARVAWHLGNRHLPVEVIPEEMRLRISWDHVIAHMVEGLGAKATRARAPFHPESGAYGQAHFAHGPDQGHGQDHGHSH